MKKKSTKKIPRNSFALPAKSKPDQYFHHKCEPRGGSCNESRDLLEEYVECGDGYMPVENNI